MNLDNYVRNHHLYCDDYPSDKVYLISAVKHPLSSLWTVKFAYGRRKQNLRHGVKAESVTWAKACSVISKLLRNKLNKGYRYEDTGYAITVAWEVYTQHLGALLREKVITQEEHDKIYNMLDSQDEEVQDLAGKIIEVKEETWEQH